MVKILLMIHPGISAEVEAGVVANTGAKVKLTWLAGLYYHYVESSSCVWVARVIYGTWSIVQYLSTSPQLKSMSPTSNTLTTWMLATSMHGEYLHIGVRLFAQHTFFSGFIRCRIDMRPYRPERVSRQFTEHSTPATSFSCVSALWLGMGEWQQYIIP